MSSQSITNKLVANIKQTSSSNNTSIISDKVICIDSSKNAIGINTLNPSHALTISGSRDNSFNAVKAPYLYITNSGIIEEISTNFLFANDASINDLSLINADFSFIKGFSIDISKLDVSNITIKSELLRVATISCDDLSVNNLTVINTISGSLGKFNQIDATDINFQGDLSLNEIDVSYLTVNISGDISFLTCNTISADIINSNSLDVAQKINASSIDASFMFIRQDLSINGDLSVNASAFFNTISANSIEIDGLDINVIVNTKVNNLLGDNLSPNFSDVIINGSLTMTDNNKIAKLGNTIPKYLKLPDAQFIPSGSNTNSSNYVYFNNNTLYIGDQPLPFTNNKIYLTCSNDVLGQKESDFDITSYKKNINNYNNLEINRPSNLTSSKYDSYSFKFIPLNKGYSTSSTSIDFSLDEISGSYLQINDSNIIDKEFELYANASFKFYNKNDNDVEVNSYVFGVYDISNPGDTYTSTRNSIMVFDNSFNYANSSLNYYGIFPNSYPRLRFYVGSVKDNSFIYIDSLSVTIKF